MAAAVRIEAMAFADERIELLGDLAGYNRHEALGRLARLWSYCTDKETDIADEAIIRAHLGLRGVEALAGSGLGEQKPDGSIRLRGGKRLFWLRDKRACGRKGGEARAAKAAAAAVGGEPQPVAMPEPKHEAGSSPSCTQANGQAIAKADGTPIVIALSSGTYVPEGHTQTRARVGGPGPRFAAARKELGLGRDEAAKALGLATSDLAALEVGSREPSGAEANELDRLLRRANGELCVGLDEQRPVLQRERREVAKALWAYQEQVRHLAVPDARPLKMQDLPGGPIDAIVLILATWSPADCVHALDMAALEAECRGMVGEDPLLFLNGRTNWKPEQFERLVQATPDQIRARASPHKSKRRPTPSSMAPAAPEEWRAIAGRRGGD